MFLIVIQEKWEKNESQNQKKSIDPRVACQGCESDKPKSFVNVGLPVPNR